MSDSRSRPDDLFEELAKRSADAAREAAENRRMLRDDPEFTSAQRWLAESRGEMKAIANALRRLQRKHDRGWFEMLDFAEWAYQEHIRTNEWRSEETGQTERAAKGHHHGYHEVLNAVQACSDLEYEDYAGKEVA